MLSISRFILDQTVHRIANWSFLRILKRPLAKESSNSTNLRISKKRKKNIREKNKNPWTNHSKISAMQIVPSFVSIVRV